MQVWRGTSESVPGRRLELGPLRWQRAFSLVELIVVMSILIVVMSLAIGAGGAVIEANRKRLQQASFQILDQEVHTASYATAVYLQALKPRSCWVMVDGEGLEEFEGFQQDLEHPEYIVVGDNRSKFDFQHLNKALRLLLKGAKLIGMQGELTDRSIGDPELNVGSWVGMLERAAGVGLGVGVPV